MADIPITPICIAQQEFQKGVIGLLQQNEIKNVVVVENLEQLPKVFKYEPIQLFEPVRDYIHFQEPKNYITGKKLPRRRFKRRRK